MAKLQAKNRRTKRPYKIKDILTNAGCWVGEIYDDEAGCEIDGWVDFDQLAEIVDYLREPQTYQLEAIYSGFGLHGEKTSQTVTRNFSYIDDAEDYISDNQILKVWKSRYDFDPKIVCLEYPLVQYKITAVYKVDVKKVTL